MWSPDNIVTDLLKIYIQINAGTYYGTTCETTEGLFDNGQGA